MAHCVNCGGLIPNLSEYHITHPDTWCKCGNMELPKPPPAPKPHYLTVGGFRWTTDDKAVAQELVELLKKMSIIAEVAEVSEHEPRGSERKYALLLNYKKFTELGEPSPEIVEFLGRHRRRIA